MTKPDVPAHDQAITRHYTMHFPEHPARENDPHYKDFEEYRRRTKDTAKCAFAERTGDDTTCHGGLELHHAHVEFSLQNGVDLAALEKDYPGISDPSQVGEWVESAQNFRWLCAFHHRGPAGAHTASHSDWEASQYVQGLITATAKP